MNMEVRRPLLFAIVLSIAIAIASYLAAWVMLCRPGQGLYCDRLTGVVDFYSGSLRGSLFTGFLTLGGFLLSLKTFIVVNMKKEVYDSPTYQQIWADAGKRGEDVGTLYSPLRDLSESLHYAIAACVLTSAAQFTVGLFEFFAAAAFCLWAATLSMILLLICLFRIRSNLNSMFKHLEHSAKKRAAV